MSEHHWTYPTHNPSKLPSQQRNSSLSQGKLLRAIYTKYFLQTKLYSLNIQNNVQPSSLHGKRIKHSQGWEIFTLRTLPFSSEYFISYDNNTYIHQCENLCSYVHWRVLTLKSFKYRDLSLDCAFYYEKKKNHLTSWFSLKASFYQVSPALAVCETGSKLTWHCELCQKVFHHHILTYDSHDNSLQWHNPNNEPNSQTYP